MSLLSGSTVGYPSDSLASSLLSSATAVRAFQFPVHCSRVITINVVQVVTLNVFQLIYSVVARC